jgi:spermidine dehydrogenase
VNDEDKRLGMDREITRRDFLEGSLQLAAGATLATGAPVASATGKRPVGMVRSASRGLYPPAAPGLRGSHAGSFETAHELAWEGRRDWGPVGDEDTTDYDLVVVGAGVSGLSAAYFYRQQNPNARVLILDNHDDFGGHAKRNEFAWQDRTILGYGGSQSLEAPSEYSDVAKKLLAELAVDVDALGAAYDQDFYRRHDLQAAIYFDRDTFGRDVTVRSKFFEASLFLPLADSPMKAADAVDAMPISDTAKAQLKAAVAGERDRLPEHSIFSEPGFLSSISYQEFFTRHLGVTDPEAWRVIKDLGNSYFGHGMDMVPAIAGLGMGLPGLASTSLGSFERLIRGTIGWLTEPYIYHFPDGNASIARLLVRRLMPQVAPGQTMEDVVTARFDYSQLDDPASDVRLRLNSTVVNVSHDGDPASARTCFVTYLRGGAAQRIRAKRVVLACYNMAIPHLCPEMPAAQKAALAKLVKVPMCSTNVLLRNWHAVKAQRIGLAHSPGRWNRTIVVEFPVSMDGYNFAATPDDPIMLHCLRGVTGDGTTPEEQSRAGRYELLGMSFADYERELRRHLEGMLGPGGFDPASDIAAITVNRWPHGYAWNPNPLFDPEFEDGKAPHEVGRRPFGRVAIANSDAGARAYLDCAIDEAWRAVSELD